MTGDPSEARLFTVGHSNTSLEAFLSLLQLHAITAVADVRSSPFSHFNPHYNREPLADSLANSNIRYVFLGQELGARRSEPECYEDGKVIYDRVARTPMFHRGLDRVRQGMKAFRVALLCSEKDHLTCHRTILVCRSLRMEHGSIFHIATDGGLESQSDSETRLLELCGISVHDLFHSREELVQQAYDVQGDRIAYRTPMGSTEDLA